MRALVVYESMFGNTHIVADRIANGLRSAFEVMVVPVAGATAQAVAAADLIVCGGPTHVHGMSSATSRRSAVATVEKPDNGLSLEPDAQGPGLRELFDHLDRNQHAAAAAFDTRVDAPALFTGRASRAIARRLADHGFRLVVAPESFLVDKQTQLLDGEADRAERWGRSLAASVAKVPAR